MKKDSRALLFAVLAIGFSFVFAVADDRLPRQHNSGLAAAPASARTRNNPYDGKSEATRAGRKLFKRYCADCHGEDARGQGKAPSLDTGFVAGATSGDLYWFLTNGDLRRGMPSWSRLPEQQRWQIVTYLKTLPKAESH
jgi:mono/diheme cytochrome c family protein